MGVPFTEKFFTVNYLQIINQTEDGHRQAARSLLCFFAFWEKNEVLHEHKTHPHKAFNTSINVTPRAQ